MNFQFRAFARDRRGFGSCFRTYKEAHAYRSAVLAYRQLSDRRLLISVERLRRSATISYGHNR
jgi:hypothetical protein